MNDFEYSPSKYQNAAPFPHLIYDDILNEEFAKSVQEEILQINPGEWDRYDRLLRSEHEKCKQIYRIKTKNIGSIPVIRRQSKVDYRVRSTSSELQAPTFLS
jgi:hypothetical protein